jgi:hypothetical protein
MTDDLRSPDYLQSLLADAVQAAGGQVKWAAQAGVSPQYVCDCLKGRRYIGPLISQALGFEPVTMYAPIKATKKRRAS